MKRKKVISIALTMALTTGIGSSVFAFAEKTAGEITKEVAAEFANPSAEFRAGFRYELPGGQVDLEEVKKELQQIKEAGFAVVEITANKYTDVSLYGIDTDSWRDTLKTIYATCNELGIQADIHLSFDNGQNLMVPGLEITDEGAAKEIVEAHETVTDKSMITSGSSFPVTAEAGIQDNISRNLVRAYLAKVVNVETVSQIEPPVGEQGFAEDPTNYAETEVNYLDPEEIRDITECIAYDEETNTAVFTNDITADIDNGNYVLIGIYEQGYIKKAGYGPNSIISAIESHKMDYFSEAGTKVFTEFYETKVFDEELLELMRENGGDLFSDSYGADQNWTKDFLSIFEEKAGYDLADYLPVLFSDYFDFSDDTGTKIRNDHKQILTELYCKYHLEGLTEWANSLGMQYRDQVVYSAYRDMMTAAMYVDVPETESLYFMDEIDNYLAMSSPANLTRKEKVSTELGALRGRGNEPYSVGSYSMTWNDIIVQANRSLAGGVNQMLLHTFPYLDGENYTWPGYTAMGSIFSESWSTLLPSWQDADDIADYLARAQYLMRKGTSVRDVVIYKHSYDWGRWSGEYITDPTLTREGYTFDFINPDMMQTENAVAENGVIDIEGGQYRALIIDSEQYPFMNYWARPESDMMSVETALTIEQYAETGVPIIVVGEEPSRSESFTESNEDVRAVFERMHENGQLIFVESESEIANALRELEIRPNADNNTECGVTSYLRTDSGVNYYFLYNQGDFDSIKENPYTGGEAVCDQVISLKGEGQPYLCDLWSGEIVPIADYTEENGYVNVPVRLEINEATMIAVGNAVSEYTEKVSAKEYFETVSLDNWELTVESWTPTKEFGTTGVEGTLTDKTDIGPIALTELKAWKDISEIGETVSGIGTYTTTFTLDQKYTGAVLSIGEVFDTVSIKLNGIEVTGINQFTKEVDLRDLIVSGENVLEIQSASTLRNVLRIYDEKYAEKKVQAYGILGPVTLTPYMSAEE